MERIPEFRVVGNISPEEKEKVKDELQGHLYEDHMGDISEENKNKLEKLEYPKTDQELAFIDLANKKQASLWRDWASIHLIFQHAICTLSPQICIRKWVENHRQ